MRILLLPGAFKGSLSALRAGQVLARVLSARHTVRFLPISDGGDGFIEAFSFLDPHARLIKTYAKNAFLKTKPTRFLMLSDGKTAVIETARICGLGGIAPHTLDPLHASSYGVGQVLLAALKQGATRIYVGLGGVACSDGGAGLAVACGARLSDKKGSLLPLGAQPLLNVARADFSALQTTFKRIKIWGVTDVTNPVLGPRSSAKVFGPQKGATAQQVALLDKALTRWTHVLEQATGRVIAHTPATAAAGAIGAGLYGFFHAPLLPGAELLAQKAQWEQHLSWADLIITSEGKLDAQTFYGKAPGLVLKLAKKHKKPVLFICGQADWKALSHVRSLPSLSIAQLTDFAPCLQAAKKQAARYLGRLGKNI